MAAAEEIIKQLNRSGYPFQLRVEQEVVATFQEHGWLVASREQPWSTEDGTSGFIDMSFPIIISPPAAWCWNVSALRQMTSGSLAGSFSFLAAPPKRRPYRRVWKLRETGTAKRHRRRGVTCGSGRMCESRRNLISRNSA
jgi:hypothetical protein